ncbi:hypothetical protein V7S74_09305 [Aquirufa sp. 2-AUSEE-184A6]|jgi:Mn-containing catalase|uniref:Uncharacterized protein n=1 Tax=Aquirufa novilacunae TaxID=3139305 RepID=A0ABW8SX59_9BACT
MSEERFQTLHPQKGKVNKNIALDKYLFIKSHLLDILTESELSHLELMEELFSRVNGKFTGGVQWYGETVKLDLEARQIIARTSGKPQKYKLKS